MAILNATNVRSDFYNVLSDVATTHEPTYITSKTGTVVMISEEDYKAMQESLFLLSVPNMRESILEGMATSVDECESDLEW